MTEHGTRSRYTGGACRCDACRAANAEYQKNANVDRARRIQADPSLTEHGESTYQNWCCRCAVCAAAHKAAMSAGYHSRKARLIADPSIRPHGTRRTYAGWGCRCEACTNAAAEYARSRREATS